MRNRRRNSGNVSGKTALLITGVLLVCLCAGGIFWYQHMKSNEKSAAAQETGKNVQEVQKQEFTENDRSEEEVLETKTKEIVDQMTLEEKTAQMFMITPEALTGVEKVIAAGEKTEEAIRKYPVGGIIYFTQNLQNPEQVRAMTENTQKYSMERIGLPLLLSVDEEGGIVTRFGNTAGFDYDASADMNAIGSSGDTQQAYDLGKKIGSFLYGLGFNTDNAPDADVLSNPDNTVVKDRSFGSDPDTVSAMVQAELKGLEDQGITGVLKHFPGHGATAGDTHEGYAYTDATLDEMKANELVPFADGIQAGADMIMAAHIACPQVTGNNEPSSLSEKMISEVLRKDLGYDGVVITDAMNMGAIAENYGSAEAAVKAVQAGADMILMPQDFQEAYNGVLDAVAEGNISEERINESVERIVRLKLEK